MTAPVASVTYAANTILTAGNLNLSFADMVTYVGNRNDGTSAWDRVLVTSASAVPLIVNNSTGTSNIANFQDNGSNVFQIVDGGDVYSVAFTDYSATSTIVGWTSFTTKQIYYKKIGNLVWVWFFLAGTSNDTTVTFTIPYTASTIGVYGAAHTIDNGSSQTTGGRIELPATTSTVAIGKDMTGASWTNSGTKRAAGHFVFQST